MGSRVYAPGIGRFLSIDPTPGGNANIYDYCTADPINCTDLTGNWPDWGAVLNVVAIVAEVVATVVPGPIGTAAGFISAGAYLATGNTSKAAEMAITAGAALLGCGACAKAAIKVVRAATAIGRGAAKVAKAERAAGVATKAKREGGVYALVGESGRVYRTGKTNNLARREVEHAKKYPGLKYEVLYKSNSRRVRAGLEEIVENHYTPMLLKKRAMSLTNKESYSEY